MTFAERCADVVRAKLERITFGALAGWHHTFELTDENVKDLGAALAAAITVIARNAQPAEVDRALLAFVREVRHG